MEGKETICARYAVIIDQNDNQHALYQVAATFLLNGKNPSSTTHVISFDADSVEIVFVTKEGALEFVKTLNEFYDFLCFI